jgi:hypothetical protein
VHLLDAQQETEEHRFEHRRMPLAEEGHRMAARVFALKLVPLL